MTDLGHIQLLKAKNFIGGSDKSTLFKYIIIIKN